MMLNNKKAEGTASRFLIAIFLLLTIITVFSTLTLNVTNTYGKTNPEQFAKYNEIYEENLANNKEIYRSQDEGNQSQQPKVSDWVNSLFLVKAYNTIRLVPKSMTASKKTLDLTFSEVDSFIEIPVAIKVFLVTLVLIMAVFLVVKLWTRYNNV